MLPLPLQRCSLVIRLRLCCHFRLGRILGILIACQLFHLVCQGGDVSQSRILIVPILLMPLSWIFVVVASNIAD